MIGNNYRSTVQQLIPVTSNNQPHSTQLFQQKDKHDFIETTQVRGYSNSNIEKMTHPLAQPDDTDYLSPYMIDLLGKITTLAFAEKVLQSPRKRLLDKLGIDDTQKKERQTRLFSDHITIARFYNPPSNAQPISLTLNGSPFIEQEPTTPYFSGQKIITPDFRMYRSDENTHLLNLLRCTFRDDSEIPFDKAPIESLQKYNDTVYLNETRLRDMKRMSNKAEYFIEMTEYLIQRAKPGDFIVQNSLESSSDKNTAHFQYIPDNVSLPVFFHAPQYSDSFKAQIVDWHLPSLYMRVDLQKADWREPINHLQNRCQQLLNNQHTSTTPTFRKLGDDQLEIYLIFKKDCSSAWNMTPKDIQQTPGWLEACGIFIAGTAKSEIFNSKGAKEYYATYRVTAECIKDFINSPDCADFGFEKANQFSGYSFIK